MDGWLQVLLLLAGAAVVGGVGAGGTRWVFDQRGGGSFLNWVLTTGAGGMIASALATLAVLPELPGGLDQRPPMWTLVFALATTLLLAMVAAMLFFCACMERATTFSAGEAGRVARLLAIPTVMTVLAAGGGLLQFESQESTFSVIIVGLCLSTIVTMMGLGAASLVSAVSQRDDRTALWVVVAGVVNLVLAVLVMVVLALAMMTSERVGPAVMRLMGLLPASDPALGTILLRWFGCYAMAIVAMAGGGMVVRLFAPAIGPSIASLGFRAFLFSKLPGATWNETSPNAAAREPSHRGTTRVLGEANVVAVPAAAVSTPPMQEAAEDEEIAQPAVRRGASSSAQIPALTGYFPTRGHYAFLALAAAVFVFYASLVPVEYKPLAWNDAVARFKHVRYYELDIGRRADVLANLVVIVPVTFLLMGALQPRGAGWIRKSVNAILAAVLAGTYVVAIEFTQEWFPPRTVSQNDLQAGASGALIGIILWLAAGEHITHALKVAVSRSGSATALRQVLGLYVAALVVYSLFPMDFTMDPALIAKKYEQGRVVLVPFLQGEDGVGKTLLIALRDVLLFLPVGVLLAGMREKLSRYGGAVLAVVVLAVGMELLRLPVFTSETTTLHVVARILGGMVGLSLAGKILDEQGRLSLGRQWTAAGRRQLAIVGALGVAILASAVLLYPFQFDAGEAVFRQKLGHFINWPFQLYYWAGEWTALSKVVLCMAAFAGVGVFMRWGWDSTRARLRMGLAITLLIVAIAGSAVEVAHAASGQRTVHVMTLDQGLDVGLGEQAMDVTDLTLSKGKLFSIGKVSDLTDLLAYLAGAWLSWLFTGLVLPRQEEETATSLPLG